jgi:hypothetical protein
MFAQSRVKGRNAKLAASMVQLHQFSGFTHAPWAAAMLYCALHGGVLAAILRGRAEAEKGGDDSLADPELATFNFLPGACTVQIPAAWQCVGHGAQIGFVAPHRGVRLRISAAIRPPAVHEVLTGPLADLIRAGSAPTTVHSVREVALAEGPVVRVQYETGLKSSRADEKKVPLAHEAYLFYKGGRVVTLTLWAPVGLDDISLRRRIVESFSWR